jgi:predicted O-methyltransferase YrrM
MMSGLIEARLLQAVVRLRQARRALEVGTFTGPGALAMDEALAPGGSVTTLEDGDPVGAFNDVIQTDARVENALLTIGDGVLLVWP